MLFVSAQGVADLLWALACAASTDARTRRHSLLAVAGGLSAPVALLAMPFLLLGSASTLSTLCALAHLGAALVRFFELRDETRPLDRGEPSAASSFHFLGEQLYRAASLPAGEQAEVEVAASADGSAAWWLSVSGVPTPARIRALSLLRAEGVDVVVINVCSWWTGHAALLGELGIEHVRLARGRADVTEMVHAVRKRLTPTAAHQKEGQRRPVRVLVHCETGALAAVVAAGFVHVHRATAAAAGAEVADAVTHVQRAVGGRLPFMRAEATRLVTLLAGLLGFAPGPGRARHAKQSAAGGGGGRAPDDTPPSAAAAAPAGGGSAARGVPLSSSESDDDEADEQAARQERWATYQEAVRKHGLPSTNHRPTAASAAASGGWTAVTAPVRRPAAASYAAVAAPPPAPSEGQLTDKQRKNRRKQEKAKEETARREAERRERLQETIRQRARGP